MISSVPPPCRQAEAGAVIHRRQAKKDIIGAVTAEFRVREKPDHDAGAMRQHYPFGLAGGAGCIRDCPDVPFLNQRPRLPRGVRQQCFVFAAQHDDALHRSEAGAAQRRGGGRVSE
jgi:hypothetical protein